MANIEELVFRVSSDTSKMGNPFAQVQRDIEKATDGVEDLQDAIEEIDGAQVKVDANTQALTLARSEIARLRAEVADAFVINPQVDTRLAERTINALKAKIKALTIPEEEPPKVDVDPLIVKINELAARSGIQVVSFLAKAITNAGSTGGPIIAGAIAGLVITAMSMAGALIAAGGGFAGLTVGIVGALKDPAISAAAGETVDEIKEDFFSLGENLKGPVLSGLEQIGVAIRDVVANVGPDFDRLGGVIDVFAAGLAEMIRELGPGIASALRVAGPVLTEIAAALPMLGGAISGFFIMLNANSAGAALSMKLLMLTLTSFIITFTMSIGQILVWFTALAKAIEGLRAALKGMDKEMAIWVLALAPLAGLATLIGKAGDASAKSAAGIDLVTQAEIRAAQEAAKLAAEDAKLAAAFEKVHAEAQAAAEGVASFFGEIYGQISGLDRAIISVEGGWDKLNEALKDGERTLKLDSQAGRDNASAMLDQIDALKQHRDARVAMGESVLVANRGFSDGLDAIRQNALELGYNEQAVEDMIDKYEDIPVFQMTEIRTTWSQSANPDVTRAALEKEFGVDVVQKVLVGIDHESVRLAKEYFGKAFGDRKQELFFAKLDPEGFQALQEDIKAIGADPTAATVKVTAVQDESFKAITTQLETWNKTKPAPSVVPAIEPEAYGAVLTTLFELQKARPVPIVPYVDGNALEAVRITLNSLALASNIKPTTSGSDIDRTRPGTQSVAPSSSFRPRIYIDGNEIRAVIRGEVNQSVSGSTVAPTRYRRL